MILVDTSVWINYFKGVKSELTEILDVCIEGNDFIFINPLIYQELLQGTSDMKGFKLLKEYLETQKFCYLQNGKESYSDAAKIYFKCRRGGLTIRSTTDCLIAQYAIENNLRLMHFDKDFDKIASVIKELKIYKIH